MIHPPRRELTLEAAVELAELYARAPATTDVAAYQLCEQLGGHHGEGLVVNGHALGRCQRCGLGLLTDH